MKKEFENSSKQLPRIRKRVPPLSVRMTKEEKERVRSLAAPMSVNAYARALLLDPPSLSKIRARSIRKIDHAALGKVLAGLGRSKLSNNLNQISKMAHIGALPVSDELEEELFQACADIKVMRETLINALNIKFRE